MSEGSNPQREKEYVSSRMSEREKGREATVSKIIQIIERDQEAAFSKIEELEKENEAASSKLDELVKEKEDALSKIDVLEKEKRAASNKIDELVKEKEDALSKIDVLEKEKRAASNKIDELEKEKEDALSKIDVLEKEKRAASNKIDGSEKEKEEASSKIVLLEKDLRSMEECFGKYKNAQLGKEEELRAKYEEFVRKSKHELVKENEAALNKIVVLEKELKTKEKEVEMHKQAVRSLRQIREEDKEPTEKVKELKLTLQNVTDERNYWENLVKQLKSKKHEGADLAEVQKEMIRVFSELWVNGDMDIGIKKFGAIDMDPFLTVCKQRFSDHIAVEKGTQLCSIWQAILEDPNWHPFKAISIKGQVQGEMIDREDEKLQKLRNEWGNEVYLAVVTALKEIKEYNPEGRSMTTKLWNFKEVREATLKEAFSLVRGKMKEAKIKDAVFVKVDQLKPCMEDMNLLVKVLNTEVVAGKNRDFCRRYQKQQIRIAESLIGDETGAIIFTARNEQVDLMKPGCTALLYGAKIEMFRNSMRLTVKRCEQIKITEPAEFVVRNDNNLSLVEYELVDVEE